MRNELLSGTLRALHLSLSKLNSYIALALASAPAHEEAVTAHLVTALNSVKNATRSTCPLHATLVEWLMTAYSLLDAARLACGAGEQGRHLRCGRSLAEEL